jgi:hypothetical protein
MRKKLLPPGSSSMTLELHTIYRVGMGVLPLSYLSRALSKSERLIWDLISTLATVRLI